MGKVRLTLTGRQCGEDGEEQTTKTDVIADYHEKNGSHYFFYEEKQEEAGATTKNTLKLKGSLLELTKRGAFATRIVFEAGREYRTDYATPYGCLPLEIATTSVESTFQNGKIEILIAYTLSSGSRLLSNCTLAIKGQPLPGLDARDSAHDGKVPDFL